MTRKKTRRLTIVPKRLSLKERARLTVEKIRKLDKNDPRYARKVYLLIRKDMLKDLKEMGV